MPTIKDVAKLAGVSHGTVSNVINGLGSVSLENVKKVEEAIKTLGYKPNISARNLKSSKIQEIAIILPNIMDPLFASLFTSLNNIIEREGYKCRLYLSNDIMEKENEILDAIFEAQLPGAIITTCQPSNKTRFEQLLSSGTKLVFIEREPQDIDCNFVGFDNKKSIINAMKFLSKMGYKTPGLIIGRRDFSSEKLIFDNFNAGIVECDYPLISCHSRHTTGTREDGFKAAIELINTNQPVDSIICSSIQLLDGITKAACLACNDKKPFIISLGDDLWNIDSRENVKILPRPYFELAEKSVDILLSNIRNPIFFEYKQMFFENSWNLSLSSLDLSLTCEHLKVAMVDGEMADAVHKLLPDLIKKTNTNISIDTLPYDKLYETISNDKTRAQYDIFTIDSLWFRELYSQKVFSDLTPYIDEDFWNTVKINPELLNNFAKVDNSIYSIPYHYSNQLLFYRRDLFENPINKRMFYEKYSTELKCPNTWMEFNAVAQFFTKKYNPASQTVYGTTLGGDYPLAAAYDYLPRFWAYGATLFDKYGNISLDSKSAIKALENYCESYQYASEKSSSNWLYGQLNEFMSGQAAMMILDSSYASKISNPHYSKVTGKVDFAPVPDGNSVHWIWNFTINKDCKKKDVALSFIKWICSEELAMPTTLLGNISACSSICSNAELFLRYPWIIQSLNTRPNNILDHFPTSNSEISAYKFIDMIAESIHNCVSYKLPASDVLKDLTSKITKIYDK